MVLMECTIVSAVCPSKLFRTSENVLATTSGSNPTNLCCKVGLSMYSWQMYASATELSIVLDDFFIFSMASVTVSATKTVTLGRLEDGEK